MPTLDLFAVSLSVPLMSAHLKSLGASHFTIGALGSLYPALQLISGPIVGSWSDIKGRRSILVVTMAICSISYLALGATTAISVVFLVRIILGVLKHTQTLCKTLVADVVSSAKQADVSGKLTAYSSIGFMVGPAIGGNLAELENGFTLVCCVVAVIFWANLAIAYIFVPLDSGDADKLYNKQIDTDLSSKKAPHAELLRAVTELANVDWAHYWDVFALKFLLGLAMANFFMQYGLAIQDKFEVSPKWVGYTISFQGTISVASSFSSSWLERLYGASDDSRARQMFHSFAVLTISFFLIDYAPSLGMFVIGLLPMSASTSLLRLSTNDMVIRRTPPDKRGSLVGSGNSISSVARLIAPIVSGSLHDLISRWGTFIFSVASAGLGTLLSLYLIRNIQVKKDK
uniref:Major facilitator superfamily (MFS) profile domain-containing protein n=1 Tax=Timema douglasi TaxID=61478 RepID=A0A7R8VWH5_TIMDO|nr:unnamed protein product [Timema douglasi]